MGYECRRFRPRRCTTGYRSALIGAPLICARRRVWFDSGRSVVVTGTSRTCAHACAVRCAPPVPIRGLHCSWESDPSLDSCYLYPLVDVSAVYLRHCGRGPRTKSARSVRWRGVEARRAYSIFSSSMLGLAARVRPYLQQFQAQDVSETTSPIIYR